MESFEMKLDKYASLAVEVGVNIQPGQILVVSATLHSIEYVRKVVKRAYELGARHVHVEWIDDVITRTRYEMAPEDSFSEYFFPWKAKGWEEMAKQNAAFLSIIASSPDLLQGIEPDRIKQANIAAGQAMTAFRKYTMSDK